MAEMENTPEEETSPEAADEVSEAQSEPGQEEGAAEVEEKEIEAGEEGSITSALHLDEQLGEDSADDSGVEEAQGWAVGGNADADLDEGDEVASVRFAQLEPGIPQAQAPSPRLNNVEVDIVVELGRTEMKVRELINLKEQDVIQLNKLAGEAFEVRVNGRLFAEGEVVVLGPDEMSIRITRLNPLGITERPERD